MKPTIIFKEGREGEMTLDAIKGIALTRLDGKDIIIFPKYKALPLLEQSRIKDWKEPYIDDEIEALYAPNRSKKITDGLLKLDSPAAKFVRSVSEDFDIPGMLSVAAIRHHREEIDALAEQIKGADRIGGSYLWSCFRSGTYSAWYAGGNYAFFGNYSYMYDTYVVVPVAQYS